MICGDEELLQHLLILFGTKPVFLAGVHFHRYSSFLSQNGMIYEQLDKTELHCK